MHVSRLRLLLALLASPGVAAAQAGAYITADDPGVPVAGLLIARGDVVDPSPQVRPWRRDELLAALHASRADSASPAGHLISNLILRWTPRRTGPTWALEGTVGAESYSSARRDLLRPAGEGGTSPYATAGAWLEAGPFAAGSRAVAENRLARDPDWVGDPAQRTERLPLRVVEGWVTAVAGPLLVHYGQVDRNWGPAGMDGIALANGEAYARPDFSVALRRGRVDATLIVRALEGIADSAGVPQSRAFVAHRVGFRVSRALHVAAWEALVIGGPPDAYGRALAASIYPDVVVRAAGATDTDRSAILGFDFTLRPVRAVGFELQVALRRGRADDTAAVGVSARAAVNATAFGPLSSRAAWQVTYSHIGTQLYSATSATLDFTDFGVGIARTFTGVDRATASIVVPLAGRFVVQPGLALQRQRSNGLLFPLSAASGAPIESTREASVAIQGQRHAVRIDAVAAIQDVVNAGSVSGRSMMRFEGRIVATIGLRLNGSAQ